MERFPQRLATLGVGLALLVAGSAQAQVVISQVYGGGGNAGAPYRSDFIELHNTGAEAVDLSAYTVQYASGTGTTWQKTNLTGTIAPGGYYLVKEADGSNASAPGLPAPDATGSLAMGASAGKVALVASPNTLPAGCPANATDLVAYGAGSTCAEGGSPTGALGNAVAAVRIDDCADGNNNAADFAVAAPAPRNRASAPHACAASRPALRVEDAAAGEGQDGRAPLGFRILLSAPAGNGGVTFRYRTVDGTATAGQDYVAVDATATVPAGATYVDVFVDIVGDVVEEADETFGLEVTDVAGADVADASATGRIVNDDFPITPIGQIQGAGARSPWEHALVATRGIVTGRTSKGFFLQSRDVDADAEPMTSEGIFVYTGSAPPAIAQPGRWVVVRGTVTEYAPADDPGQQPFTEIGGAVFVSALDDATHPLPAPVELTTRFPDPHGGLDQLERVESMRVTVHDFVATAPTGGFVNEAQASATSDGLFYGTVAGLDRPFREPGIQAPDAPPAGSIPPIPQWDFNPEVLSVDSEALGGAKLDLAAGAHVTDLTGPLNYSFRRWQILVDPQATGAATAGPAPRAAPAPESDAFTVAGYNMERFFDDVDEAGKSDVRLAAAALERRLSKASLGIRDALHMPDILGVVEMENLAVLQRVADRVNADAVAAGGPNPGYVPYLVEGNDVGGIDVGFLVKRAEVAPGVARVEVVDVQQVGKDVTWQTPDMRTELLNDRPPLALKAVVHYGDGRAFPVNVVIAHQRSLRGAETADAEGTRIRAKRQRQAEFLAGYLDGRQHEAPDTRIVVLGDFNAFEFNDGLADTMGTVAGTPSPDEQTAVDGDGHDRVDPDFVNLTTLEPGDQRYSFSFDGNAQSLDHVLVNEDLVVATRDIRIDHARINADFPEVDRNDAASPSRLSDHDPVVAYFVPRRRADLQARVAAAPVVPGEPLRFDVTLHNAGPEQADRPEIGFELEFAAPDLAVAAPTGWACTAATVEAGRTSVDCAADALAPDADAAFALSFAATPAMRGAPLLLVASASARSLDPDERDNAANAQLVIPQRADLAVGVVGLPVVPGGHVAYYAIGVVNTGPDAAVAPQLVITGNAPASGVRIDGPSGWTCPIAADGTGFRATCRGATQAARSLRSFTLRLTAPPRATTPQLLLLAQVSAASADPVASNDASTLAVKVTGAPR